MVSPPVPRGGRKPSSCRSCGTQRAFRPASRRWGMGLQAAFSCCHRCRASCGAWAGSRASARLWSGSRGAHAVYFLFSYLYGVVREMRKYGPGLTLSFHQVKSKQWKTRMVGQARTQRVPLEHNCYGPWPSNFIFFILSTHPLLPIYLDSRFAADKGYDGCGAVRAMYRGSVCEYAFQRLWSILIRPAGSVGVFSFLHLFCRIYRLRAPCCLLWCRTSQPFIRARLSGCSAVCIDVLLKAAATC